MIATKAQKSLAIWRSSEGFGGALFCYIELNLFDYKTQKSNISFVLLMHL